MSAGRRTQVHNAGLDTTRAVRRHFAHRVLRAQLTPLSIQRARAHARAALAWAKWRERGGSAAVLNFRICLSNFRVKGRGEERTRARTQPRPQPAAESKTAVAVGRSVRLSPVGESRKGEEFIHPFQRRRSPWGEARQSQVMRSTLYSTVANRCWRRSLDGAQAQQGLRSSPKLAR